MIDREYDSVTPYEERQKEKLRRKKRKSKHKNDDKGYYEKRFKSPKDSAPRCKTITLQVQDWRSDSQEE